MSRLTADDLTRVSAQTCAHYEANADAFWAATRDHDVRQNIHALLAHLTEPAPCRILDFGCGPGRDLKTLSTLGHEAIGLDGCGRFVELARAFSGCEVWQQDFLALDLPPTHFDGVFANAALFHVPSQRLPDVLAILHATLRADGVLFVSNPCGNGEEGWRNGRYGVFHDLTGWRNVMHTARFIELEHYYRPAGLPREQQGWLASVWRKC